MGPNFRGKQLSVISKKSVKEGNHCPCTSQQSDMGSLTHVSIDYYPPPSQILPLSSFRMEKRRGGMRRGMETETTMSIGDGPSSG
jgi:hypothetical protein